MSTKHNLIQERLNLKRAPLDEWNTHEQLCLASAVACSGDQNWMSVSRALKQIVNDYSSRPPDWFISKSCATQYGKLLESVETPKRKKRTASERDQPIETPSTPVESLVKKLTNERILELKKAIAEDQRDFAKLKEEILFLQSDTMDEARIYEMWNEIEQEEVKKEQEQVRYNQWLEERERKKLEIERQWRPNYGLKAQNIKVQKPTTEEESSSPQQQQQQAGTSSSPSPLLTSLLKSSQANQMPIQPSNTSRSAPTITNLLTGTSSSTSSSNSSPSSFITQSSSTNAQNNLINASVSVALVPNAIINHSASVQIPVSQTAPTLITLLDKKLSTVSATSQSSLCSSSDPSTNEKQQLMLSISVPEGSGKDGSDVKDEDEDILVDFNLITQNLDDDDLEDINAIIMNPEILEDKITDHEPSIKDVDDSSQATSTDDYDKLKIKQLVENFAGSSEVEQSSIRGENIQEHVMITPVNNEGSEVMQIQSEAETSNPTSVELIEPTESNDSKQSPIHDEKVMIISDESSNTNDTKKEELSEKMETGEAEESQSVKSSIADDVKDGSGEDSTIKDLRVFEGLQESDENSALSEKHPKAQTTTVYQLDDSDEDLLFEDAKENQEASLIKPPIKDQQKFEIKEPEKVVEIQDPKPKTVEVEEITRSGCSADSDDEILEVKVSRSIGRKKAADTLKADTPRNSTRSRDQSENDDKDSTPIRTRSRHSSSTGRASDQPKPLYNFSKEQDHSMWKERWDDCLKTLQKHKDYSTVVDNKVIPDDTCKSIILTPMNIKTVQKNIENHFSTLPGDIKKDFALMCTNIIMLNKKGSKFNDLVHQFMKDAMEIIDSNLEVEEAYKSYRKQIKKKH
ncbi:CLUMA_CG003732, isoform A [Clunio marinus]|uniref:CLUMA_CG003732, isoform A n=1 Tax=Clunio marinus TaxID=568069 RepID=A0A1J1HU33_9DIPT|nr:CLUMA_CG003732, isoform A [Clunio marinus]